MQKRGFLYSLHVIFFVMRFCHETKCQPVDTLDFLIQNYLSSQDWRHHNHRHTRECQHISYGNVTRSKYKAQAFNNADISVPVMETRHAVIDVGPYFNKRGVEVHFTVVNNPLKTFSVLEPAKIGGCEDQVRSTVIESGKQKNCLVAVNAGFFNTHNGSCLGNVISDGRLVLDSEGVQNAHFGITKDSHLFSGYLSEIDLVAEQFYQLVGGVIWIIRDGKEYISESINIECQDTEETGTLQRFATVMSSRTAVGHDKDGRVLIMQADGKTDENGLTLYEFAQVLLDYGFVNAINLDGGGSSTYVINGTLVNYPTDQCTDDKKFNCARNVSSILCVHEPDCSPHDCSGHGTCQGGKCLCNTNWAGHACDHLKCTDDCSNHGICSGDGCLCSGGWMGDNCNTSCPAGYYGKNCLQNCSCATSSIDSCDPIDGHCTCQPGFTGMFCEKVCPVGFYGNSCLSVCLCPDECPCHPVTGSCSFSQLDHHYMQVGQCYAKQEIQRRNLVPDKSDEFRTVTTTLICISIFAAVSAIVNIVLLFKVCTTKKKVKHKKTKGEKSKLLQTRYKFENMSSENEISSFSDYPMELKSFSKASKEMANGLNQNSDQ